MLFECNITLGGAVFRSPVPSNNAGSRSDNWRGSARGAWPAERWCLCCPYAEVKVQVLPKTNSSKVLSSTISHTFTKTRPLQSSSYLGQVLISYQHSSGDRNCHIKFNRHRRIIIARHLGHLASHNNLLVHACKRKGRKTITINTQFIPYIRHFPFVFPVK